METASPSRCLLTFNDDNPGAGPLTRVLHSLGFEVHHLPVTGHQPILTDPGYQEAVRRKLIEVIDICRPAFIIPMFEEVFFLSEIRDELKARTLMSPPTVYRELHSKRAAFEFNRRHGIPQIPTLVPDASTRVDDLCAFAVAHASPRCELFLKEDDSRGGYGTEVFRRAEDLWARMQQVGPHRCVIQPFFPGEVRVLQGMYVNGRLIDHLVLRKLSLWTDAGTVRMIPFQREHELQQALDLLQVVGVCSGYDGMLEFECLGEHGDLRVLEYNPRFSGAFLHSVWADSSLAENTARAYAGMPPVPHRPSSGITKTESIFRRYIKRTWSQSRRSLLDPRWILRWIVSEAAVACTVRRSRYRLFSQEPASRTDFLALRVGHDGNA